MSQVAINPPVFYTKYLWMKCTLYFLKAARKELIRKTNNEKQHVLITNFVSKVKQESIIAFYIHVKCSQHQQGIGY